MPSDTASVVRGTNVSDFDLRLQDGLVHQNLPLFGRELAGGSACFHLNFYPGWSGQYSTTARVFWPFRANADQVSVSMVDIHACITGKRSVYLSCKSSSVRFSSGVGGTETNGHVLCNNLECYIRDLVFPVGPRDGRLDFGE